MFNRSQNPYLRFCLDEEDSFKDELDHYWTLNIKKTFFWIGGNMVDDHQLFEFLIDDTTHDEELVKPTPDSHQQPHMNWVETDISACLFYINISN